MTDRHCIASNGASKPYLSAHNILTCCGAQECGSCEGGYPLNAWQFWSRSGVVTGGAFGSSGTCQPYEWAPCEHHTNGSLPQCVAQDTTPACKNTCSGGMDYAADKSFGSSAYKVAFSEDAIMNEIMTHGPVEAGFMVYEDFPHYKSGVYQHTKGNMIGGHAVKLLGWGVEGTQKYWLVANSWNTNWGDQGYFKIAKGQNECMIEDMVFAGRVRA
jgi:cathepsin B